MAIAISLMQFLETEDIDYDVVHHPHTSCSTETAEVAHVPGRRLAKGVVLEDGNGHYMMAVVPSNRHVDLGRLHRQFQRHIGLATEDEIKTLFPDCEPGSVPPLGMAYGIPTIIDCSLEQEPELYLEGGFHDDLVHLPATEFEKLLLDLHDGNISRPM